MARAAHSGAGHAADVQVFVAGWVRKSRIEEDSPWLTNHSTIPPAISSPRFKSLRRSGVGFEALPLSLSSFR
jgi:hypothetical protein